VNARSLKAPPDELFTGFPARDQNSGLGLTAILVCENHALAASDEGLGNESKEVTLQKAFSVQLNFKAVLGISRRAASN
jgi:hypothetical protein